MSSLSILTPSLTQRRFKLNRLASVLMPQRDAFSNRVEWLVDNYDGTDANRPSIGEARNRLMDRARKDYIAFVDDDDLVSADYCKRLLEAMALRPDVIMFQVEMKTDGEAVATGLFGLDYEVKTERFGGQQVGDKYVGGKTIHYRYPNHLCAIKRQLLYINPLQPIRFPDADFGEDNAFSNQLRGKLRSCVNLPEPPMYFYDYRTGEKEYKVRKQVQP